jgi:hypothetical protein
VSGVVTCSVGCVVLAAPQSSQHERAIPYARALLLLLHAMLACMQGEERQEGQKVSLRLCVVG